MRFSPTMLAFSTALCVTIFLITLGMAESTQPGSAPKPRIGTYDNRAVAIAYAHSATHAAIAKQWQTRFDDAKATGDEQAMDRVRRAMDRGQWLAHRQGFGTASVDDAMLVVKNRLPEVAKSTNVVMIVCNADYVDLSAVECVDITDKIVDLFEPNERVLKIVESMKQVDRISIDYDFQD